MKQNRQTLLHLTTGLILLLSTIALSGCSLPWVKPQPIPGTTREPVYSLPAKEPLEAVPSADMNKLSTEAFKIIVANHDKLIGRVNKLEAIINSHNDYAKKLNKQNGFGDQ